MAVDGFDSTFTQWDTVGDSPYLDTYETDDYIETTMDEYQMGDFTFEDTAVHGKVDAAELYIRAKRAVAGNDYLQIWMYDDSHGWQLVGNIYPTTILDIHSIDVSSKFDIPSDLNTAKVRIKRINQ